MKNQPIKRYRLLFLFAFTLFLGQHLGAQTKDSLTQQNDSLSFEAQRAKVNKLLDDRSRQFGAYDESLTKKTGVFGLFKTKGDMQKSIDILREIVINDNHIFMETRKLLNLKDAQSARFQKLAAEYDEQVSAYMKTITKLQQENDSLRGQIDGLEQTDQGSDLKLYLAVLVILSLIGVILFLIRKQKRKKLTIQ